MRGQRRGRFIPAVIAALLAVLVIAACGEEEQGAADETSEPAQTQAQATAQPNPDLQGEVTIGAAVPTTGPSATIGKDQQRGIELAVEQVNAGEGVLGKRLSVVTEDTQAQPASAVQAARKLVTVDNVPVVIGEYLSNATIAIGKYLQREGVVHINPGSSSPDIADIGDFSFSTIALDTVAGSFVAQGLYDAGYRRMAFLGPNNAYGAEFSRVLKSEFDAQGGEVVETILYTEGQDSYRTELQRIQDADPDVLVYASYVPDSITINREAFELGIPTSSMFGIYLYICTEGSEPAAIAGQQGMALAYTGPSGEDYLEAYRAKYGEDPITPYSGYAYDATMMAAAAINEAGSAQPNAIRKTLRQVGQDYAGATGTITFDQDGQRVAQDYAVLQVDEAGELIDQPGIQGPGGGE